jgi:hypothetical protein
MPYATNLLDRMRTRKSFLRLTTIAALTAVLSGATALPAGAATPTTFTVTGGALTISAPTASVSLGSLGTSNTSGSVSGPLGLVTVSDLRGGTTTWVASVISTAFTPIPANPAVPAIDVSYATGTITQSANVVAAAVATTDLTGVSPVVNGASTGVSSASWTPTISVFIPANFAPGIYSGTITHSVA